MINILFNFLCTPKLTFYAPPPPRRHAPQFKNPAVNDANIIGSTLFYNTGQISMYTYKQHLELFFEEPMKQEKNLQHRELKN
jgi:hypothetical protein